MKRNLIIVIIIVSLFLALSGCRANPATPAATITPTATEAPLALKVNNDVILLSEYQAELTRLQQAQTDLGETATPEEQRDRVIQDLTEQLLLTQGAAQNGFSVDDATLQARIDSLAEKMGGQDKLTAWESSQGYTDESFRTALRRSIAAAWQRDHILESVPTTADQVHARQILVQDEANANSYYAMLQAGKDFNELAYLIDPTLGGDLGWFPRGYLTQSAVEDAAFNLQPGQYSAVIHSDIGYHIIFVIERDANHELSADARRPYEEKAINDWLDMARNASQIEVLVQ